MQRRNSWWPLQSYCTCGYILCPNRMINTSNFTINNGFSTHSRTQSFLEVISLISVVNRTMKPLGVHLQQGSTTAWGSSCVLYMVRGSVGGTLKWYLQTYAGPHIATSPYLPNIVRKTWPRACSLWIHVVACCVPSETLTTHWKKATQHVKKNSGKRTNQAGPSPNVSSNLNVDYILESVSDLRTGLTWDCWPVHWVPRPNKTWP